MCSDEKYYVKEATRSYPVPQDGLDLGLLEVGHYASPEGQLYPEEVAYYAALVWCVEGELIVHTEVEDIIIPDGYVGVISPDTLFSTSCKGERTEFWYMALDGTAASEVLSSAKLWQGVFAYKNVPQKWLEYFFNEITDNKRAVTLSSMAKGIFDLVRSEAEQTARDKLVWQAQCILHEKWHNVDFNIESMITELRTTRSTLTSRFQNTVRRLPQEYLNNIRYKNALELLKDSSLNCSEVGKKCGFADPNYFSRWFKARNGQSPTAIRQ